MFATSNLLMIRMSELEYLPTEHKCPKENTVARKHKTFMINTWNAQSKNFRNSDEGKNIKDIIFAESEGTGSEESYDDNRLVIDFKETENCDKMNDKDVLKNGKTDNMEKLHMATDTAVLVGEINTLEEEREIYKRDYLLLKERYRELQEIGENLQEKINSLTKKGTLPGNGVNQKTADVKSTQENVNAIDEAAIYVENASKNICDDVIDYSLPKLNESYSVATRENNVQPGNTKTLVTESGIPLSNAPPQEILKPFQNSSFCKIKEIGSGSHNNERRIDPILSRGSTLISQQNLASSGTGRQSITKTRPLTPRSKGKGKRKATDSGTNLLINKHKVPKSVPYDCTRTKKHRVIFPKTRNIRTDASIEYKPAECYLTTSHTAPSAWVSNSTVNNNKSNVANYIEPNPSSSYGIPVGHEVQTLALPHSVTNPFSIMRPPWIVMGEQQRKNGKTIHSGMYNYRSYISSPHAQSKSEHTATQINHGAPWFEHSVHPAFNVTNYYHWAVNGQYLSHS